MRSDGVMKQVIAAAAFLLGAAAPSHAIVLQNGVFDDGLTAWTARAETNFLGPRPPGSYVNVQQNAGNPYARLITDPDAASNVTFVSLTQEFRVTADTPMLSFDFGLVLDVANSINPPLPNEVSNFVDNFQAIVTDLDAAGTLFDPGRYILVDRTTASAVSNPSSTTVTDRALPGAGGSTGVSLVVMTQDASDPFFETTAAVDLTNLIGRDLSIQFLIRDFFDGRQSAYAIDNIVFSQASSVTPVPGPAVIPLPASMWLLATGIGAFGIMRRITLKTRILS
jgi:hypothetical protein